MHYYIYLCAHKGVVSSPSHFRPPFLMGPKRWSGTFKSKSLALHLWQKHHVILMAYYVCTCLAIIKATEVLVFSHVHTLEPSFTKLGHLVLHKRNQWAHNDAHTQLFCQRVGGRDCGMPFQEVKYTWQSGEAQKFPFVGWLRNENIPTLEELPNRLILIARRCSVSKCQKACLMASFTSSTETPFASSLGISMPTQDKHNYNISAEKLYTYYAG